MPLPLSVCKPWIADEVKCGTAMTDKALAGETCNNQKGQQTGGTRVVIVLIKRDDIEPRRDERG